MKHNADRLTDKVEKVDDRLRMTMLAFRNPLRGVRSIRERFVTYAVHPYGPRYPIVRSVVFSVAKPGMHVRLEEGIKLEGELLTT